MNNRFIQFSAFIGRFQSPHNAHLHIIRGALHSEYNKRKYDYNPNIVIICIGSAFKPRSPKDPFTAFEREEMIRSAFTEEENGRLEFVYIPDSLYNDTEWAMSIQNKVDKVINEITLEGDEYTVRLVGHKKDESSYYLDMFPQWKFIGISSIDDMHATTIRDYFFNEKWSDDIDVFAEMCQDYLHPTVFEWMLNFRETEMFELLQEEHTFIEDYKARWASAPYPPTFITTDAVVIQSGHILLVKRRAAPGRGQLALPGGFVNVNERIEDAAIRELYEETQIKVPEKVIRGSMKDVQVFDHPDRSQRGRTVTHAHFVELNPGPLPKVTGSDDADPEGTDWYPISEVLQMEDKIYEDHSSIIKYFVGRA